MLIHFLVWRLQCTESLNFMFVTNKLHSVPSNLRKFPLLPWLPKWPKTRNLCWKFGSRALCYLLCGTNHLKEEEEKVLLSFLITSVVFWWHQHVPKSLYRTRAGRHLYWTKNVVWAGFGPIGNTEKKSLGRLWATFEDVFFHVFMFVARRVQNFSFFIFFFWKCCSVCNEKLHSINLRDFFCLRKHEKTFLKLNSQSIVYCFIGDTSLRDFYKTTLVRVVI